MTEVVEKQFLKSEVLRERNGDLMDIVRDERNIVEVNVHHQRNSIDILY